MEFRRRRNPHPNFKKTEITMHSCIYLDNAATTRLDPKVLEAMLPFLSEHYGNPSSTYSLGRTARMAVESARRSVAQNLGVKPSSICFTSGGTESNNTAIAAAVRDLGCTCIITSPIEHHAVIRTVEFYKEQFNLPVFHVSLTNDGLIDYDDLEEKLQSLAGQGYKCLVTLMHANNEIGSLLDIQHVGALCQAYKAIFHSDCVQTVGHYPLQLDDTGVHFVSGAGHKFHGPKGTGILYVHPSVKIKPFIHGGGQERGARAGTENVYGIVGFARALELAMDHYVHDAEYVGSLKAYMKERIREAIPGVGFNGPENSLYTVLSVCFPKTSQSEMLLLSLDMAGICVSGGSACSSGGGGSHVIRALQKEKDWTSIRFSFSKHNTGEEVDRVLEVIRTALEVREHLPA
ncbi:MAG: cysteine desulfurase family protein [Flavisolibacter sp.]